MLQGYQFPFASSFEPSANNVQDWSERVDLCAFDAYREKFERIQQYFAPRFPEATRVGNEMIKTILEKTGKE